MGPTCQLAVLLQAKKYLGVGVLMAGARVILQMIKHREGIIQPLASMPLPLRSPMPAATINRFTCVLCVTDFSSRLELSRKDLDGDFRRYSLRKFRAELRIIGLAMRESLCSTRASSMHDGARY